MCRTAEEIIQYISQAKKQTIVKVYINGENLPDDPSLQVFGTKTSRILVGDLEHIKKYLKANQNQITDTYLQQDHRNSAIPMLDLTHINARIEPGAMIRDNVTIGDHAVIMMGAIINIGATIGEGTMIDMGAILGGRAQVGKNCHIGAGAVLAGVIEPPSASPVIIEDDVLIGANAVVVEGVHIGKGAVVGAGSIVLNDVPANAVVAGNPARIIKHEKNDATKEKTQLMEDLRNL
ncbi:MAG: 2,3,4,5-tetrahydropyridine-2,6-dicarboxylate N-acetyltransferase [Longibaculum muris]|uniref:2,3,4,5-tetrahydropyridine-2,6-dicarboxylate N-acetyltransferase n=1 Tax=Longibaculum muris TaxID=1796628 RepID=A0A4R3Z3V3_9FIRM|nr:2,3,4,5-tetrahydropyridine-2,6-dicarboxylate N-acetyltransferase [Longibaculum muris]KXU44361.1 2,3,4,5-tetrahydropyridine-2,6-dicarboxylate N-acetyltransferase [Candidatus Stoquefichus sp. KLE1796]MBS5368150.1 2,3,4,5-tetrahydropyridine-2,6-dicarboxylate N-acetyltransferase [Coprobacillus cateniformis]MCR1888533.1 2,3,4,5-tetrahydropyridine-2,6-dicarboxylate N-acetyltransferase [Longibaculum muris]MED9812572.1 2,3,4,5-tetrahydropyridine-2,6-dicarboxylate N-acetyltransferase [Longibaculum mu